MEYLPGAEKKLRNIETLSPLSALCKQDERKKHKLGSAVVAKGVSSPSLGLWLLICLFSNKSAATWPRFCIYGHCPDFMTSLFDSAHRFQK
jgi:hypothetical protein